MTETWKSVFYVAFVTDKLKAILSTFISIT